MVNLDPKTGKVVQDYLYILFNGNAKSYAMLYICNFQVWMPKRFATALREHSVEYCLTKTCTKTSVFKARCYNGISKLQPLFCK